MDKIEVKVNVVNQLKLLRQSTFKDILCFLDEDVQNAQRAKATEVRVTIDRYNKGEVIIENNGKILDNHQSLFSIAESSWDEEVNKTENPFGMGFFSNITVSNLLVIHSGNKIITFDVENMITTGNTEVKVEDAEDYYDGFKLILKNFDFDIAAQWDIEERVKILGKYIHEIDIYYNDILQEKKDLTSGDNSDFLISIDDTDFKGWIALGNNYSYGDNLSIFYKGRFITKLEGFPYLNGDLHIFDRTLNLTSPDRKNIINDKKLSDFKSLIKNYVQKYCNSLLVDYQENGLTNYTTAINYYCNKSDIKNHIKFMTFKSNDKTDIEYLKGVALARSKNKNIENFSDYELYLKKEAEKQQEENFDEVNIVPKLKTAPIVAKGIIQHSGSSSYSDGYVEHPEINESDLIEKKGEVIIDNTEPVFFIGFSEVDVFEYKLNIAKHYNLKIIVSRNSVETSILKSMKETDHVFHISELKEDVFVSGILSNTSLNSKEKRAMMIFDMISRILEFDNNIFSIGDLMVTKNIKVESLDIEENIIDADVTVLKDEMSKKNLYR